MKCKGLWHDKSCWTFTTKITFLKYLALFERLSWRWPVAWPSRRTKRELSDVHSIRCLPTCRHVGANLATWGHRHAKNDACALQMESLEDVNPSLISSLAILVMTKEDVGWKAQLHNWLRKRTNDGKSFFFWQLDLPFKWISWRFRTRSVGSFVRRLLTETDWVLLGGGSPGYFWAKEEKVPGTAPAGLPANWLRCVKLLRDSGGEEEKKKMFLIDREIRKEKSFEKSPPCVWFFSIFLNFSFSVPDGGHWQDKREDFYRHFIFALSSSPLGQWLPFFFCIASFLPLCCFDCRCFVFCFKALGFDSFFEKHCLTTE